MSRRRWTHAEERLLRKRYQDTPTRDLAEQLGRTDRQVYCKAKLMGLKKSQAYLSSPAAGRIRQGEQKGSTSQFRKGQAPWNKGMKGLQIGGKATRFKPGNTPHTHVPVGTVVMTTDGYLKKKVGEPKKWRYVHRMVWEEANGPIPPGMALVFKDGNHENCALNNLELLDRAQLMRRNTIHRYPPELKQAIRLNGKLRRTIEDAHEKQD